VVSLQLSVSGLQFKVIQRLFITDPSADGIRHFNDHAESKLD